MILLINKGTNYKLAPSAPLQIAYHMEPDYRESNCLIMHDELEKRGLIVNSRLY